MQNTPAGQTFEEFKQVADSFREQEHDFVLTKDFEDGPTLVIKLSTFDQFTAFANLTSMLASFSGVTIDKLPAEVVKAAARHAGARVTVQQ